MTLISLLCPYFFFPLSCASLFSLFFFNDTATTEIYTLSLHDALPIYHQARSREAQGRTAPPENRGASLHHPGRSEEHTSELQSHLNLVCRLLLEKKKTDTGRTSPTTRYLR